MTSLLGDLARPQGVGQGVAPLRGSGMAWQGVNRKQESTLLT